MTPILETAGLTKSFGAVTAASDINVRLEEDTVVGLIGGNGAGKTTTLRAVSGLVRPTSGRIALRGEDLVGLAPHAIVARGLAQAPEGRGIFLNLTVRENLELGAYGRRARPAAARNLERLRDLSSTTRPSPLTESLARHSAPHLISGVSERLSTFA